MLTGQLRVVRYAGGARPSAAGGPQDPRDDLIAVSARQKRQTREYVPIALLTRLTAERANNPIHVLMRYRHIAHDSESTSKDQRPYRSDDQETHKGQTDSLLVVCDSQTNGTDRKAQAKQQRSSICLKQSKRQTEAQDSADDKDDAESLILGRWYVVRVRHFICLSISPKPLHNSARHKPVSRY